MVAHVPVVFGDGNAGVDAGFPGGHGHVGRVGNQYGALDERPPATRIQQPGKIFQNAGHLVAPLPAPDVDDDVGIGPFGKLVLGDGFARAEAPGNGGGSPFGQREEKIDHPQAGKERLAGRHALPIGPVLPDRPWVEQLDVVRGALGVFNQSDALLDRVKALRDDLNDPPAAVGRNQDAMDDGACLYYFPDDLAGSTVLPAAASGVNDHALWRSRAALALPRCTDTSVS